LRTDLQIGRRAIANLLKKFRIDRANLSKDTVATSTLFRSNSVAILKRFRSNFERFQSNTAAISNRTREDNPIIPQRFRSNFEAISHLFASIQQWYRIYFAATLQRIDKKRSTIADGLKSIFNRFNLFRKRLLLCVDRNTTANRLRNGCESIAHRLQIDRRSIQSDFESTALGFQRLRNTVAILTQIRSDSAATVKQFRSDSAATSQRFSSNFYAIP
jgi:hypothetical protein